MIIVTGPENSGSKLCARIIAHVLGIRDFDKWNGHGLISCGQNSILHRSTPYARNNIINVKRILKQHEDLKFIFTSRDKTISRKRLISNRDNYTNKTFNEYLRANKQIISIVAKARVPYMFWSFETMLLYKELYLQELYKFISVNSTFMPKLYNANRKYIK